MADIRHSTFAQYHRVVKQVKRNQDGIVMTNTASSQTMLYNYGTISENFVQSLTPQQSVWTTYKIEVALLLYLDIRDKHAKVYSSFPTSTGDLHYLINNIEKEILLAASQKCYHDHHINVHDVKVAIHQMKSGRHGGHKCFFTDSPHTWE